MSETEFAKSLKEERDWGNEQRDRANDAERKNKVLRYAIKEMIRIIAFVVKEGL